MAEQQHDMLVSPATCKEGAKPLRDWTRAAFDKVTLHIVQNLQNSNTVQTDPQTYKYQDQICKLCKLRLP